MNDAQLDIDQLIEVKPECLVKPKAPNHTSIPAILKALQDEWDSVMANSWVFRYRNNDFQPYLVILFDRL